MIKYIVSKNDKYIVGRFVLNPTIAKAVTTREGQTRADASTYLCAELPDDCEIEADENGYPRPKKNEHVLIENGRSTTPRKGRS